MSIWKRKNGVNSNKCVLYCHPNAGNRLTAVSLLKYLVPKDIIVVSFDFVGCGLSDGDYITLGFANGNFKLFFIGFNEQKDIACVVKYLR